MNSSIATFGRRRLPTLLAAAALLWGCQSAPTHQPASVPAPTPTAPPPPAPAYDVLIRGGTVYDGSGGEPFVGDVAIRGDRIVEVARSLPGAAKVEVDAAGLAVSPGFVNMLSWSGSTLLMDGRAQSVVRQGVTLEVMGEGDSMGPVNALAAPTIDGLPALPLPWTTLGQYLEHLERRGVSVNVASLVGATTVRAHVLGERDVDPATHELETMRALVRHAMREGAMGVGSALIYAPGRYAETEELVALAREVAACGGLYTSHIRSERDAMLEAIDEVAEIAGRSGVRAEIHHLKTADPARLEAAIARVQTARARGLPISANMYPYTASSTQLETAVPGGWRGRDRAAVAAAAEGSRDWTRVRIGSVASPAWAPYAGKTIAEAAVLRGTTPGTVVADALAENGGAVGAIFDSLPEANVRRVMTLPWVSFGSDAGAVATEGAFLNGVPHPRRYGAFARVLGKYVRDEKLVPLPEAIRRLTSQPAATLKLRERGSLKPGYFADVVVFDPASIRDNATYERPHQYATGVRQLFVNGTQVIRDGEHTGAKPGRVVRGPGWTGWPDGGACRP